LTDGSIRHVQERTKLIVNDNNEACRVIGTVQDITERRQAEDALRDSERLIRSLIHATKDIVVFKDKDFIFRVMNQAMCQLVGKSENELAGKTDFDIFPKELADKYRNDDKKVIESGCALTIDEEVSTLDGIGYVSTTKAPVFNEGNECIGIVIIVRDITEQKKLQKEVLKIHKLESIGTLAGGIAHDFNNLLYVVMGNISIARDGLNLELETSESLKEAEQACIKAKELTARLITFSKGGDPVKKMMPINGLLKDMVVSILSESNITPKISITDAIINVNIDEGQIKQVVRNIVVNAKEAMDNNGQLTVSCENVDIAEKGYLTLNQGEYIKISFEDQGCGISKENLEKIFDPYFSTKDMGADKGQGLGLTVSHSIIQKHGGLITVESEPQIGSTFSVYLPAFLVKEPDFQKSEEKPAAQKPAIGTRKILLMDDEKAIRKFLGKVINRLGYDVETCIEGKEAVEIYTKAMESKEPFDVAILDLTNKIGMGGQATMKRLLEIDPGVKGIIITGYSDDPVVANFRAYGFSGFVIKPTTRDELSKVINEVLSKNQ
jgi:PAS domain S-box-containing protein